MKENTNQEPMSEEAKRAKAAYYKAYREKNRDKLREYYREYRRKNKEKVKGYNATYWQKKAIESGVEK